MRFVDVSTSGADEICYVRHACFAILMARGEGFAPVLSQMGGSVGFLGDRQHEGRRDLVVAAANSASEYQATLYVWSGDRYVRGRRETCAYEDDPDASAAPGATLCGPLADEVILQ